MQWTNKHNWLNLYLVGWSGAWTWHWWHMGALCGRREGHSSWRCAARLDVCLLEHWSPSPCKETNTWVEREKSNCSTAERWSVGICAHKIDVWLGVLFKTWKPAFAPKISSFSESGCYVTPAVSELLHTFLSGWVIFSRTLRIFLSGPG